MNPEKQWQLVLARDARSDGKFVYAVRSTGIFCRPTCPSRRPRRKLVEFFATASDAERAGYRACKRCRPTEANPQVTKVYAACRLIDENIDATLTLSAIGNKVGLSPFYLQRLFKRVLGVTPHEYRHARRAGEFKSALARGGRITDAIYEAGYGSSSRLYEKAQGRLGMTPSAYQRKGAGAIIRFSILDTQLGKLLVAVTEKGVCSIQFGDSDLALEKALRTQFSQAQITRDDTGLETMTTKLTAYLAGAAVPLDLPLDVQATAFQERVWKALREIPYGETRSYSEVASQIGNKRAVRAVARACATNPVCLVVPCHRVVHKDGDLAGYRWGNKRKAALLKKERTLSS
jgi:AraC family transcriptional regulator of adaptative response/methylated-DNA-[protein]-cysteine methyltransferase